nr:hypothetical protein [Tanacetum cinerariifolium]
RTSSASSSANKKPEYVKSVEKKEDKKEDKKADEKKRDMSKVKRYNCKKEEHFAKESKGQILQLLQDKDVASQER